MIYKIFGQNEGTFSSEFDAGLARQDGGHVVVLSVITVVTCQPDHGGGSQRLLQSTGGSHWRHSANCPLSDSCEDSQTSIQADL